MAQKTSISLNIDGHYYQQVVENINLGVYTTDLKRRILTWNKGAEKITGFSAEEVIGRTCAYDVLHHQDKHGTVLCTTDLCPLYRAMKKGVPSSSPVLVTTNTKSGKRRWVSVNVAPIKDQEGRVIGGVEVFEDVTQALEEQEKVKQIQRSLLKFTLSPDFPIQVTTRYIPSEMVGGDFYMVQERDQRLFFSTADFVGHGLPAAHLASIFKMGLQVALSENLPLHRILPYLNEQLTQIFEEPYLGTALVGCLDLNSGIVKIFSAGNPDVLLFQKSSRTYRSISLSGLPLGEFFQPPPARIIHFSPNNLLLFYSDGISEIRNQQNQEWGIRQLAEIVQDNMDKPTNEIFDRIIQHASDFDSHVEFEDDVTLLALEYKNSR